MSGERQIGTIGRRYRALNSCTVSAMVFTSAPTPMLGASPRARRTAPALATRRTGTPTNAPLSTRHSATVTARITGMIDPRWQNSKCVASSLC